jgi:hypothetical protein
VPTTENEQAERRRVRRVAGKLAGYWDTTQEKVPAPLLRILLTLPWLARRMPVPPWVAIAFVLLRRHRRRARRKAEAAAARAAASTNA